MSERWRDRAIFVLVLAGAAAIPLVFRQDFDMFRLPKAIAFRVEAILLLAVATAFAILGVRTRFDWRDPRVTLPAGAFAVMVIAALASTQPRLSLDALASALATLVVYLATLFVARRHGTILLAVPLVVMAANAVLVIVEEAGLWMPFGLRSDTPHHLQCTALLGNPNEVGSCLGAAALAALTLERPRIRMLAVAVLGAGLLASQTLTAVVAFSVAALTMLARTSRKRALVAAVAVVIVIVLFAPMRRRVVNLASLTAHGEYNAIFTERFTAFVAAWSMFLDRPLTGAGPGAFAWHYFDEKIEAERRYPSLRRVYGRGLNFGEVHNDHLQVLAEGGLIGLAAFATLLVFLGRLSHPLALPLAVFWMVLAIAQFPLETTVVRAFLVHLAALCAGWSRD